MSNDKKREEFREWFLRESATISGDHHSAKALCDKIVEEWKVTRRGSDRSLQQNAFLHGPLIDAFVDCFGDTDREFLKAHLKAQFLTVIHEKSGKEFVRETSSLTVREMHTFLEQCLNMLADFGGSLPDMAVMEWRTISKTKTKEEKDGRD